MSQTGDHGEIFDDAPDAPAAPLCRCCEEALCLDGHRDPDLGPVCLDCANKLTLAEWRLEVKSQGYSRCEALGPDSGEGVRP